MTRNILLSLTLTFTSMYLVTCSKVSSDKTNMMTTTEAASTMSSRSTLDSTIADVKSMVDSKSMMEDTNATDNVDMIAVMTMCNESFRTEMSFLVELNESGSFPDETDKTPKCFVRCVLENLDIVSLDDGKIDATRAAAIFSDESDGQTDGNQDAAYCAERDEACRCEMAYNFLKCLFTTKIEKNNEKTKL